MQRIDARFRFLAVRRNCGLASSKTAAGPCLLNTPVVCLVSPEDFAHVCLRRPIQGRPSTTWQLSPALTLLTLTWCRQTSPAVTLLTLPWCRQTRLPRCGASAFVPGNSDSCQGQAGGQVPGRPVHTGVCSWPLLSPRLLACGVPTRWFAYAVCDSGVYTVPTGR